MKIRMNPPIPGSPAAASQHFRKAGIPSRGHFLYFPVRQEIVLRAAIIGTMLFGFGMVQAKAQTETSVRELERLDFANGLLSRDFYQEAGEEFDRFLAEFPQSDLRQDAVFGKAECRFFLEQYARALEVYQSYLTDFPQGGHRPAVLLRCGQVKIFLKEQSQAREFFQQIDESAMGERFLPEYLFYTGLAYQGEGRWKDALIYLKRAADLPPHPLTYKTHFEIIGIHLAEGRPEEALKTLETLDHKIAEDQTWKSLVAAKRGEILFTERKYEEALAVFQDIVQRYKDQPGAADALANIFLSLFNLQRFPEIILDFEKGRYPIPARQSSVLVYITVGAAYSELEQFDRAQAVLDTALGFPDLTAESRRKLQLKKVETWTQAQEWQKALDMLEALSSSDAGDGKEEALILEAEVRYRMGYFPKAIKLYDDFLERYPDSSLRDDALYGLGYAHQSLGHREEAIEKFREYFEQGRDIKRRTQALELAMRLLKTDPQDIEQAIHLGETYLQVFEPEDQNPSALWHLAGCYAQERRFDDANNVLRLFLQRYPEDEHSREAEFQIAYNHQMAERWPEAHAGYQAIVDRPEGHPYQSAALKNMGIIYYQQGEMRKARELFFQLMNQTEDPGLDADVYLWLAEDQVKEERFSEAQLILKRVAGSMSAEQNSLFSYLQAEVYRGQAQWDQAVKYYEQAASGLSDGDTRVLAAIAKGICYKELKDWRKALQIFEQTLQENITNHQVSLTVRFEIAQLERLQNHWDEAARSYMLIAVLYQDETFCPKALWEAGQIFQRLEENDKAVKAYQEIVDRYPLSSLAAQAAEILKKFSM
jgi:tetratricopeptide (TPR) repeat protein